MDLKTFFEEISVHAVCLLGTVKMDFAELEDHYENSVELTPENP